MAPKDICLICKSPTTLTEVRFRDFDGSIFNVNALARMCLKCTHTTVDSSLDDDTIVEHYKNFSLYSTQSGVGVGGESVEDLARYSFYSDLLNRSDKDSWSSPLKVVDVGCARGGFLKYLAKNHPSVIPIGVDVDDACLSHLRDSDIEALTGSALDLPIASESTHVLSYLHVFEHINDLWAVVSEAARVLLHGGRLLIEVPDCENYSSEKGWVGPMFWGAMKEHVHHFTSKSMTALLEQNGFKILLIERPFLPMKGGTHYPALTLVAQKQENASTKPLDLTSTTNPFELYISRENESMDKLEGVVLDFVNRKGPSAFWGVGLEFFALIAYSGKKLRPGVKALIDNNSAKHGLTVDGLRITFPDELDRNTPLVICSYISKDPILSHALQLGWSHENILCI